MMKQFKKSFSLILCIMLIAAMALFTTGCGGNKTGNNTEGPVNQENSQAQQQSEQQDLQTESELQQQDSQSENQAQQQNSQEITVLGEGQHQFMFTVTDADGKETIFEIHTDKTKVGEALLDLELLSGDEGAYGLYVKTVNGITADYDKDKTYWAFYVNGEYATTGVDTTDIIEGTTYSFKVEK